MVPTVPLCQLVVFCGLPGVGKTALSRRVADALDATFLRIDTIEAAVASTLAVLIDNPVGYVVASRVAADQLHAGRPVIADAVNSVVAARRAGYPLRGTARFRCASSRSCAATKLSIDGGSRPGPARCLATRCRPGSRCRTARGSR